MNKLESIALLTSYSFLSRAFGAKPGSNRDPNDDRTNAFHVEASVAFVAEKQLMVAVAGATFLAADVVVIVTFEDGVLGLSHYLRHWLQLPRGRRH